MRLSSGSPQWRRRIGRRAGQREAPISGAAEMAVIRARIGLLAGAAVTRYDALAR
jgi:hypothetical protein